MDLLTLALARKLGSGCNNCSLIDMLTQLGIITPILDEDGNYMLDEDGHYLLDEVEDLPGFALKAYLDDQIEILKEYVDVAISAAIANVDELIGDGVIE